MCSNIPITETRNIFNNSNTRQELLTWYETITKQNYFTSKDNRIIQKDVVGRGVPSTGILSEVFMQYTETSHIAHLTKKHMIINYFCYVDDIIIFDSGHTNIQSFLTDFNSIHPNLQFTAETEQNNAINYLNISIRKINIIYKQPSTENPPLQIPLSLNDPTIPFNINMLPLDTSIIYCTHTYYIMKNIIVK